MNETEYRLRLKGEIDIEAVIAATIGYKRALIGAIECAEFNNHE